MTHHTQGPWEVMAHENGVFTVFEGGHAKNWADWSIAELNFTVQDAANARLIAAAPDLLEALQLLLRYQIDALVEDGYTPEQLAEMADIVKARDAIAKAKG